MYSGTLGRVNALDFRDHSPTKTTSFQSSASSPPTKLSPPRSPFAIAFGYNQGSSGGGSNGPGVVPASTDAIQKALAKMKEVAQTSPACSGFTEADLLACLNLSPSPPKQTMTMATHSPTKEPEAEPVVAPSSVSASDEQTILLNALLTSLTKLDLSHLQQTPSVTPPPSPAAASSSSSKPPSPMKRTPSSLTRIQENVNEDIESPRSTLDDDVDDVDDDIQPETTILPMHEAKRCLRGGSFCSRIRVRRQPSLHDLDAKRVADVIDKHNRPSIVQLTTPRRMSVLDPKTRSLSRVNSMEELVAPLQPAPLSRKSSILSVAGSPRSLSRKSSCVSFVEPMEDGVPLSMSRRSSGVFTGPPPPSPPTRSPSKVQQALPPPLPLSLVTADDEGGGGARTKKKKLLKAKMQSRMSTLASHIKKHIAKTEKVLRARAKVQLDASTRVSNMRLGTSPKKAKFKHEDLITYTRPNCRPRRQVAKAGEALLDRQQSFVSLEVMDNVGTRAACPVHLLTRASVADFSYVQGVVNSHNRRRRGRRGSRRSTLVKRPSLWIVQ
ncbi:Aste57867_24710 [Aphanomyces stellatus]|uniref:Aste57867_24710 protein n=1 Tax=Aphanomyces stellatus TaxID=120398 RepID=A0A485LVF2_9STRA|nr:hypothetical protein As57867_024632 [Aphanomyces stellatus]VFU01347.1 Aste57867_24710 [Aphanomyces stellatus]